MTRRRTKPEALPPRTHEPAIEALIAATQELLEMGRKSGDGVAIQPWDREALHKRVEAAIAAVRAPVAGASKLCTVEDGRKLAVEMLRKLERSPAKADAYLYDAYADDAKEGRVVWRTGPQIDLVGDYLQRAGGSDEARSGFTQVLTDFIVGAAQGGVPEARDYARPPLELGDSKVKEART